MIYRVSTQGRNGHRCRRGRPVTPYQLNRPTCLSLLDDETHYYRHRSTLYGPTEKMQSSQYLPARFPFLLASDQNDHVGNERHALQDDCKGEEKPDRAPHGTEIAIAMAIFFVREVFASVRERGTAAVETISVMNPSAAWLMRKMSTRSP